eukprot:COSAG06_NODE_23784_length_681_cov_1.522337_1_plen_49_part_10
MWEGNHSVHYAALRVQYAQRGSRARPMIGDQHSVVPKLRASFPMAAPTS